MIWALDAQVAAQRVGGREAGTTPSRCRPCCGSATRRASRSPRPRAAAACAARACPCSAACSSTSPASPGSSASTRPRCWSTCARERSATCSRTSCATHTGVTCGHWPQSMALSTVGGWVACRGAGQMSTRYGKIEDIVEGLDVVLADGTLITTGGAPRAAVGPDLTQVFLGSEGTLGIVVGRAAARPPPPDVGGARRVLVHRRSRPASTRCAASSSAARLPRCCASTTRPRPTAATTPATVHLLLMLDEGDAHVTDATRRIVDEECIAAGADARRRRVRRAVARAPQRRLRARSADLAWSRGRHDGDRGLVGSAPRDLRRAHSTRSWPSSTRWPHPRTRATPILDGGCLYFTFAGRPPADEREAYYRAVWDAGQRAVLAAGGALSHHHGVGLNRARFVARRARRRASACCNR